MKKIAAILALAVTGSFAAGSAFAEESPWLVRGRVVNIDPANKSDQVGGVGANDRIGVSSKAIAEVDISYFFTPNLAAELVLTYPQKHNVSLDGAHIGTFRHLPPTLTVQYHFMPSAQISPYVGAGINFTRISSVHLADGALSLENNSVGAAVQVGVDYKINKNWSINLDAKKVNIRSDVMLNGVKVSKVQVDPVLLGVGVGYRF
jgi:outer membrane protein